MDPDDLMMVVIVSLPETWGTQPDDYIGAVRPEGHHEAVLFETEWDGVDDVTSIMDDFNIPVCIPGYLDQWKVNTFPVDGRFVRLIEIEPSGYERRLS